MKRVEFELVLVMAAALVGCGEQIESPTYAVTFGPPQDLKALSVNSSSVTLFWSAGAGNTDSSFLGYIVAYNGLEDSIPKSNLGYSADSLSPGQTTFTVYSYQSAGPRSDGAVITWAPAERFDTSFVLGEYFLQAPLRLSGLNIGSQSTEPAILAMDLTDSTVLATLDLYLYGGTGLAHDTLKLYSAYLFRNDLRRTFFSTVSDSSPTLDFPLASFPAGSTFIRDSVVVAQNRIFYLKLSGDSRLDTLYARIQVTIVPGLFFPNREVEIRVSLQRVPGVPYALGDDGKRPGGEGMCERRFLKPTGVSGIG